MQGSACVEVMTTLHGSTPSLLEVCRGLRTTESSVEMLDELASTLAPIQEFMAGRRFFHLGLHGVPFHLSDHCETAPPLATIVLPPIFATTDDTRLTEQEAKVERLEARMRQIKLQDGGLIWDDRDDIPEASLPAKFRMPDIERYSGIGCPKIHLRLYNTVMRAHGIDDAQLVALFPMSLSGAAQRWFTSVEPSRLRTWEDMAHEFLTQFAFNADIDVSRRVYFFLCHLLEGKSGCKGKKPVRSPSRSREVGGISYQHQRPAHHLPYRLLQLELISLIRSISINRFIFKSLTLLRLAYNHDHHIQGDTGLIVPLAPRPLPHPIPPHFRSHEHCLYHQIQGHDTESCSTLHYAIYDLIDSRLVDLARPSVTTIPCLHILHMQFLLLWSLVD
ncbi:hypothetical protein CK203_117716 [Vitis vinifera]|uniref:Retrotransposon gag domain-containing protein n=1 Tax=Vitis vinifera TaxID=29760 RepID=A0A438FCT3_VITVI|nr:hypothetical protein CK203_117716 [Vitis vinifera]